MANDDPANRDVVLRLLKDCIFRNHNDALETINQLKKEKLVLNPVITEVFSFKT